VVLQKEDIERLPNAQTLDPQNRSIQSTGRGHYRCQAKEGKESNELGQEQKKHTSVDGVCEAVCLCLELHQKRHADNLGQVPQGGDGARHCRVGGAHGELKRRVFACCGWMRFVGVRRSQEGKFVGTVGEIVCHMREYTLMS
jgi:hypothetical protein